MTYRVAVISQDKNTYRCVEREAVPMSEMKEAIVSLVRSNQMPLTSTIHVEEEYDSRKVVFRNLLYSLSFLS